MERSVKDEVINKVDELIDLIKNDNYYKRYKEISLQMKNNEEIMSTIRKIKSLQKEIVNLEYIKEDVSVLEEEYFLNLDKLNSYPIYQEYTYLQEDLNNMFQNIKGILEQYINNLIK